MEFIKLIGNDKSEIKGKFDLISLTSQIAQIEKDTFNDPWSEHSIYEMFMSNSGVIYLCFDESGIVVSYMMAGVVFDELEIYRLATYAPFRGRKLARILLDMAVKDSYSKIMLEVRASNKIARKLYENAGFIQVGCRKSYYQCPDEDAILYDLLS